MATSAAATHTSPKPEYARLHLGTAPDSWGIWFPDDPKQPHWSQFLDEVAETGFRTIELGPYGYLPTNPERLKDELGKRGLTLTGGTVGTATHRGREAFEQSRRDAFEICELLAAMNVHHLVALPEMHTDLHTGALTQPAELTAEQWGDLAALGRDLRLIIGQDMYPAPVGSAKAIAPRTRELLHNPRTAPRAKVNGRMATGSASSKSRHNRTVPGFAINVRKSTVPSSAGRT